jgi:hypothetical protein
MLKLCDGAAYFKLNRRSGSSASAARFGRNNGPPSASLQFSEMKRAYRPTNTITIKRLRAYK